MNPFTSTTLNYDRVQERRQAFERAAVQRRLTRAERRAARNDGSPPLRRPPDPVRSAAVLTTRAA